MYMYQVHVIPLGADTCSNYGNREWSGVTVPMHYTTKGRDRFH